MDPITDEEDVKYYMGRMYVQEKDYIKAIKIYKEGLALNPRSAILLYELGLSYLRLNNKKRALSYWKKVLKNVSAYSYLGVLVKEKIRLLLHR